MWKSPEKRRIISVVVLIVLALGAWQIRQDMLRKSLVHDITLAGERASTSPPNPAWWERLPGGNLLAHKLDREWTVKIVKLHQADDTFVSQLHRLPELRRLELVEPRLSPDGWAAIGKCRNLRQLYIRHSGIPVQGFSAIAKLSMLDVLKLEYCRFEPESILSMRPASSPHEINMLRDLSLCGSNVSDLGLMTLSAYPYLERLDLSQTQISDSGMVAISHCVNLQELMLAQTPVSDAGLYQLKTLRLSTLNLSNTQVTGEAFHSWWYPVDLATLNMSGCRISRDGMIRLSKLRGLIMLDLGFTATTDRDLAMLQNLFDLHHLRLRNTQIEGHGLHYLSNLNRLACIDLREAPLKQSAVSALATLTQLRQLNVAGTRLSLDDQVALQDLKNLEGLVLQEPELAQLSNQGWIF